MTNGIYASEEASKIIAQTVAALNSDGDRTAAPPAEAVVAALIAAEKQSKRAKAQYGYGQLLGSWRLRLVSGTQKVRVRSSQGGATRAQSKPLTRPGKGRYLPELVKIQITYADGDGADGDGATGISSAIGTVENSVSIGPLQLCLTGPTRFWPATNSLAFDFTAVTVKLGGRRLYNGTIRGGQARNQTFETQSLKDQAFFTFFAMGEGACEGSMQTPPTTEQPQYIAARGKGGGLALWTRSAG